MNRELDVQVATVLGQTNPPTYEDRSYDWEPMYSDGTWKGTHWISDRTYEEVEWPKYYSTNWSAMGELVQLARCGFDGHAAAVVEIHVFDHLPPNDCVCRIYGPDLRGAHACGDEIPEVVAKAFVGAYGKDLR